jgi:hypothetical protein
LITLSSLGVFPPGSAFAGAAPDKAQTSIAASPPRNTEHHRATDIPFEKVLADRSSALTAEQGEGQPKHDWQSMALNY